MLAQSRLSTFSCFLMPFTCRFTYGDVEISIFLSRSLSSLHPLDSLSYPNMPLPLLLSYFFPTTRSLGLSFCTSVKHKWRLSSLSLISQWDFQDAAPHRGVKSSSLLHRHLPSSRITPHPPQRERAPICTNWNSFFCVQLIGGGGREWGGGSKST